VYSLILEGDANHASNIILAIQKSDFFKDWNFASIILDINPSFLFFFAFFL